MGLFLRKGLSLCCSFPLGCNTGHITGSNRLQQTNKQTKIYCKKEGTDRGEGTAQEHGLSIPAWSCLEKQVPISKDRQGKHCKVKAMTVVQDPVSKVSKSIIKTRMLVIVS